MTSAAENELLTRIDGDAPMGRMMRENWWIPFSLSAHLVHGDGPMPVRLFGENVTTAGLDLNGALIGEIWQFGEAVVQVTAPRIPCIVFRNWIEETGWIKRVRASGRPGPYLRVLRPGVLGAGDPIGRLSRPAGSITVAEALEAYYERDAAVIRRMVAVPGHSSRWDSMAEGWLAAAVRPAAPAPG